MNDPLKRYFNKYLQFEDSEITTFLQQTTTQHFSKNEFLLKEGEVCKYNFFLVNGLVRLFYINHSGQEQIIQFAIENWWTTNLESFIKGTPSLLYIQALENTSVIMITKNSLDHLFLNTPKFERLFRIITENMLIANQRRSHFYMKLGSKERYQNFASSFPEFIQRVPQYMIASYLEITPEYLSAIRKLK